MPITPITAGLGALSMGASAAAGAATVKKAYDLLTSEDEDALLSVAEIPRATNMRYPSAPSAPPKADTEQQVAMYRGREHKNQANYGTSEMDEPDTENYVDPFVLAEEYENYGTSEMDEPAAKPQPAAKPPPAAAPATSATGSRIVVKDGAWTYEILGGGKVKILTTPANSTMKGATLDPAKIAALPAGEKKDRLQLAYDSIKSVANNGPPLARFTGGSAKPKAAAPPPATEPAAPPPATEPEKGLAEPNPISSKEPIKRGPLPKFANFLDGFQEPNYFDK